VGLVQFEFTLKALANFNPGFALKPWGWDACLFVATLKELRRLLDYRNATLSGFVFCKWDASSQGCQSATLG